MENKIREILKKESEENYRNFLTKLIPETDNILGVRLPTLRKLAKRIFLNENWRQYINSSNTEFMEETMLKGIIIGLIKDEPKNILQYVKSFVPQINNWAICDSFCASLKFTKLNQSLVWDFLQDYLYSDKEYEIRFAAVMMLNFFIDEDYITKVLNRLDKIKSNDYYAQMAVAWAISICFAKYSEHTLDYLKKSNLSNQIFNKSIQKCLESRRNTLEMKNLLRMMKK